MQVQVNYDEMNANWDMLLKVFHKIEMGAKGSKEQYESLIEMANIKPLIGRQREGILARCKHAIAGIYGNTKTDTQLNHGSSA